MLVKIKYYKVTPLPTRFYHQSILQDVYTMLQRTEVMLVSCVIFLPEDGMNSKILLTKVRLQTAKRDTYSGISSVDKAWGHKTWHYIL